MLAKGSFKDGANRLRQIQLAEIIEIANGTREESLRRSPHSRQAFPIWGIDQGGRIPNFFNR